MSSPRYRYRRRSAEHQLACERAGADHLWYSDRSEEELHATGRLCMGSDRESGTTSVRGGFSMANDVLYDNLGILSAPAQLSATCDTTSAQGGGCVWNTTAFLANGGFPSQPFQFPDAATARVNTSSFVPDQRLPYSETWNLGIQHSFGPKYVAEIRYVGTRGLHLPVQTRLNTQSIVTPSNFLPTYLQDPGLAVADSLPLTLADLQAKSNYVPAYANAGFDGARIVSFEPFGQSIYHGLQTQLSRNFNNGLQFQVAWTWSHAEDNSTADVFSTYLTPRRPQDFQNFAGMTGALRPWIAAIALRLR